MAGTPYLIVFSHLRWGFIHQRPQHLISRLAAHYKVLFIEEPVFAEPPARIDCLEVAKNVEVITPRTPIDAEGFHDDQLRVVKPMLTAYLRERGIDDYLVWFYTPMALPTMSALAPRAVIYDCMDDVASSRSAPRQMRQREAELLKAADLVLTSGPALYEAKRTLHSNVQCLPSAVDASHYAPANLRAGSDEQRDALRLQGPIAQPRLGFFGVIDERIDLTLLAALADADERWQIVMVGPVLRIDPATLPRRPNIHWLGMQAYSRLPQLVAGWDVALMPFALNESTRFMSPTKTLEYMAAEKPVVSTNIPDVVSLYGDVVRVSSSRSGFIEHCRESLGENGRLRAQRVMEMTQCVARFSWDQAARTVKDLIDAALQARSWARPLEADANDAVRGVARQSSKSAALLSDIQSDFRVGPRPNPEWHRQPAQLLAAHAARVAGMRAADRAADGPPANESRHAA
ncbi:glycosyltransferase family 1 protein [soil metagenome]